MLKADFLSNSNKIGPIWYIIYQPERPLLFPINVAREPKRVAHPWARPK